MLCLNQITRIHSALQSNSLIDERANHLRTAYRFHRIILDIAYECVEMFIESNNRINDFLNRGIDNGTTEFEVLNNLKVIEEVEQIQAKLFSHQRLNNINDILKYFSIFIDLILQNEIEDKLENKIRQNDANASAIHIAKFIDENSDKLARNFELKRRKDKIVNYNVPLEIDDIDDWINKFKTLASKLDRIQDEYWEVTFLYLAFIESYDCLVNLLTPGETGISQQSRNIDLNLRCSSKDKMKNKFKNFLNEICHNLQFKTLREKAYSWATDNSIKIIISYCIENGYALGNLSLQEKTYDLDYIANWLENLSTN
jgi:hypothetical protein